MQLLLNLLNEFMKTLVLVSPNYLQGAAENAPKANIRREMQFLYLFLSVSLSSKQTMEL